MTSKQQLFDGLVRRVQSCRKCLRMDGRQRVVGPANGPLDAKVMFVAEAPGRLGADRFGIPLYGDQAGRNFEALLAEVGLSRNQIFVTNAVLCNPRDPEGRNARPTREEISNCAPHLAAAIELVAPMLLVPLGETALIALCHIKGHRMTLGQHATQVQPWNGMRVVPLYHPGPRALIHRGKAQQAADYRVLRAYLDSMLADMDRARED